MASNQQASAQAVPSANVPQEDIPLGIKAPLLPQLPLGWTPLQRKFMKPLGATSLTVLDPSFFSAGQTVQAADFSPSFENSPFFEDSTSEPEQTPALPHSPSSRPQPNSAVPPLQTNAVSSIASSSVVPELTRSLSTGGEPFLSSSTEQGSSRASTQQTPNSPSPVIEAGVIPSASKTTIQPHRPESSAAPTAPAAEISPLQLRVDPANADNSTQTSPAAIQPVLNEPVAQAKAQPQTERQSESSTVQTQPTGDAASSVNSAFSSSDSTNLDTTNSASTKQGSRTKSPSVETGTISLKLAPSASNDNLPSAAADLSPESTETPDVQTQQTAIQSKSASTKQTSHTSSPSVETDTISPKLAPSASNENSPSVTTDLSPESTETPVVQTQKTAIRPEPVAPRDPLPSQSNLSEATTQVGTPSRATTSEVPTLQTKSTETSSSTEPASSNLAPAELANTAQTPSSTNPVEADPSKVIELTSESSSVQPKLDAVQSDSSKAIAPPAPQASSLNSSAVEIDASESSSNPTEPVQPKLDTSSDRLPTPSESARLPKTEIHSAAHSPAAEPLVSPDASSTVQPPTSQPEIIQTRANSAPSTKTTPSEPITIQPKSTEPTPQTHSRPELPDNSPVQDQMTGISAPPTSPTTASLTTEPPDSSEVPSAVQPATTQPETIQTQTDSTLPVKTIASETVTIQPKPNKPSSQPPSQSELIDNSPVQDEVTDLSTIPTPSAMASPEVPPTVQTRTAQPEIVQTQADPTSSERTTSSEAVTVQPKLNEPDPPTRSQSKPSAQKEVTGPSAASPPPATTERPSSSAFLPNPDTSVTNIQASRVSESPPSSKQNNEISTVNSHSSADFAPAESAEPYAIQASNNPSAASPSFPQETPTASDLSVAEQTAEAPRSLQAHPTVQTSTSQESTAEPVDSHSQAESDRQPQASSDQPKLVPTERTSDAGSFSGVKDLLQKTSDLPDSQPSNVLPVVEREAGVIAPQATPVEIAKVPIVQAKTNISSDLPASQLGNVSPEIESGDLPSHATSVEIANTPDIQTKADTSASQLFRSSQPPTLREEQALHPQPFSPSEKGAGFKVPLLPGEGFRVRAAATYKSGVHPTDTSLDSPDSRSENALPVVQTESGAITPPPAPPETANAPTVQAKADTPTPSSNPDHPQNLSTASQSAQPPPLPSAPPSDASLIQPFKAGSETGSAAQAALSLPTVLQPLSTAQPLTPVQPLSTPTSPKIPHPPSPIPHPLSSPPPTSPPNPPTLQRSSTPPHPLTSSPNTWDSIHDLLTQTPPPEPSTHTTQQHSNALSPSPPLPKPSPDKQPSDATPPSPAQLEQLAQAIYQSVRQRLILERERTGLSHSRRLL